MKKEDILSVVVYLLMFVAAIVVGTTVLGDLLTPSQVLMNPYLFAILTIILSVVLNVVALELLHMLGAKIGGYKVVSVNMLGFCFEKINNKWEFSFKDFDGFTGETKIVENKEKTNLKPYIWAPLIGYLTELVVGIFLINLITNNVLRFYGSGIVHAGAALFIVVSSMIAFYNIIPLRLDTMTDGYKLVLLSRQENIEAFNELARIQDLERNSKSPGKIKTFEYISEITTNVNVQAIYEMLSSKKYEEAEKLIDFLLTHKEEINEETFFRLQAQKLYVMLLTKELSETKTYYQSEVKDKARRFIANDSTIESLRAYILIAGLLDDSEAELEIIRRRRELITSKTLKYRAEEEEKLIEEAFAKIRKEKPDWFKA